MNEDYQVIDIDREVKAWLIGIGVSLGLFCLGHFALIAIGLDADKVCCIFSGVVMLLNLAVAMYALMFGIIAEHEYYQRPLLEDHSGTA